MIVMSYESDDVIKPWIELHAVLRVAKYTSFSCVALGSRAFATFSVVNNMEPEVNLVKYCHLLDDSTKWFLSLSFFTNLIQ